MQMSEKKGMRFTHKYSKEKSASSKCCAEVLCAASGSGNAHFIRIPLLLLFSVIMCYLTSAAITLRKHGTFSSRVTTLKQMRFIPRRDEAGPCSDQLLSPGWAALVPSLCSLSIHWGALSTLIGSQFKMDQKACDKSCILSQLLTYVPSAFCKVSWNSRLFSSCEHQLSHKLQLAALI